MTSRKLKPAPPLWKLVVRAMEIIGQERDELVRDFAMPSEGGKVVDPCARRYLSRYNRWLKDARVEIGWGPK